MFCPSPEPFSGFIRSPPFPISITAIDRVVERIPQTRLVRGRTAVPRCHIPFRIRDPLRGGGAEPEGGGGCAFEVDVAVYDTGVLVDLVEETDIF